MSRAALAASAALLSGCALGGAPPETPCGAAPPEPLPEFRYAPPTPGMVWVPGAWSCDGTRHVWVPGRWESPPPAR